MGGLVAIMMLALMGASPSLQPVAAQGPTPTPTNPEWLAFSAARTALEDEIQRNIQYVRNYEWAEAEFDGGISSCRTLQEGEREEFLFFGWRFFITLLNGEQYEVRTSFDYTITVVCDEVTMAAGSAPAPVTNPNLQAPVVGPVGPGGLEVGGQVTGLFPAARQALQDSGMRWVKFQAASRPLDQVIALINESHTAGFKVLISAVGDHNTIMDPRMQDEFAAYVGQIARAGADAIEVWNEPNIEREWQAGQISGGNYTALLAKSYNAIKSANPNTLVISGAPAPTGFFGAAGCSDGGCNDDVFYRQMAEAGAAQYMDCVGVHYNEGVVSPRQSSGDPRDNYPTRYFSSNLNRALAPFPGKQACFTEIGYLSPEGYGALPGNFAWAGNTTVEQHAQWLGEAVSLSRSSGRVRLFIVFNVDFTLFTDDPQGGYAMIRPGGGCPACATIRAALSN